ncbi:hypothetical protein JCM10207_003544 [Rhodosporidiobolus poonsookiae]
MQNQTDLYDQPSSYSAVDFAVGFLITIGASLANALGLNIQKLDFTRQEALPPNQRKPDFLRPYWLLGIILYIASQVVGSTLALNFLPAQYVAPLGSTSLVFNFIFAYLLVGTAITRLDIGGTCVIILGVVGTVVFGNIKGPSQFDESNLSLSLLKQVWGRSEWIGYIVGLEVATVLAWWLSRIAHEVCMARVTDERGDADRDGSGLDAMVSGGGGRRVANPYESDPSWLGRMKRARDAWHRRQGKVRQVVKVRVERWAQSRPDDSIRKLAGFCWSVCGGLLSGQTLILAKSGVKLVTSAISKSDPNQSNQFTSPLSWLIVILLVVCAVAQVYCLNASLKCFDSTFCVPVFFATYTVSGFINSLVYLDETKTYPTWSFTLVWLSIAVLILGVVLLSAKKAPKPRARAGSTASGSGVNPFQDPQYELDSPVKPGFARTETDLEAAGGAGAGTVLPGGEGERKRGQGFLSKLFGGLPSADAAAVPSAPPSGSSSAPRRHSVTASQASAGGRDVDLDSVLASGRTSQVGDADELEMDEVDRLGSYAASTKSGASGAGRKDDGDAEWEEGSDFGEFEEATGARRVEPREEDARR